MRIRTIKPEFWKHEALSELPEPTILLAVALLNYADDEGYFNANHRLIKAECCPLREPSVTIQCSLTQLSNVGYLRLGKGSDGRFYGHILNFLEHQVINRPKPSKISNLDLVWDQSRTDHGSISDPSHPEGKGREQGTGKGTEQEDIEDASRPLSPDGDELSKAFDAYNATAAELGLPIARVLDAGRRKQLAARLKTYGLDGWLQALANLRELPFCLGENDRGWRASFDFLIQAKSFPRVLEKAYGGQAMSKSRRATLQLLEEAQNNGNSGPELPDLGRGGTVLKLSKLPARSGDISEATSNGFGGPEQASADGADGSTDGLSDEATIPDDRRRAGLA